MRNSVPNFNGYLPNSLTLRCFALLKMFLMATFNLVLRALSFVILAQIGTSMVLAVFGGELAFYFLVKIARKDYTYWLPVPGKAGNAVSFFIRMLIKISECEERSDEAERAGSLHRF